MGKFTFTETEIPGVVVIEPQVFGDDRGYFMETYQKDQFAAAGIDKEFVQDNQSRSTRGVLRGLHFHMKSPSVFLIILLITPKRSMLIATIPLGLFSQNYHRMIPF